MAVIDQSFAPEPAYKRIGQQRIQVIGNKHVAFFKEQIEEKTEIVFCIENPILAEEESHAVRVVRAGGQLRGVGITTSHQGNIIAVAGKKHSHLVHTGIRVEIVGNR